jgi:simple sugar transport system ATP-binding protein
MAREGIGIILITHKLKEIQAAANRVLVLRLGAVAGLVDDMGTTDENELARMMCGRDIVAPVRQTTTAGDPLLTVEGLETAGHGGMPLRGISLEVRGGEILGIAGVSGNGQRALADVLAGVLAIHRGTVTIAGHQLKRPDPLAVQAMGLGRIPEDRMTTGLVTTLPLADSMVLPRISQPPFSRFGILDAAAIDRFAREQIERFDIRCRGPQERTGGLSGGNLQKALLARELAFDPRVLLAAQPTRGLDIGAAHFVHEQFLAMRARGCAIVLISEDVEELTALSDRIAVMYEGRIAGTLPVAEATAHRLSLLMSGSEMAA